MPLSEAARCAVIFWKIGWDVIPLLKDPADQNLAKWIADRLQEFDTAPQEA